MHADARGFLVVLDGMGGEADGELAAETGCAAIIEAVRGARPERPILPAAFALASSRIAALASGPAAAAAAVRVVNNLLEVAHQGDVRVYLHRTSGGPPPAAPRYCPTVGALTCVTRDHSSICELVERGHVERSAAGKHPLRSRLNRALGRPDGQADVQLLDLVGGDRVMVCSDGLWSAVEDGVIASIMAAEPTTEEACARLLAAALAAGGPDNIGIAVLDVAREI